ncbi:hypothetical protein [Pelagibacterium xiamenense]|uniref:hypothetical protein n=1 Tax=Pelagibacterium xiamenense TaxID=2901140 RepID=UPI001E2969F8|nr:hypothetical protein [Pelagibacterium xiamenense]MCD7060725.1 hypothetical protein [Pelagibacterium xiamenense]
MDDDKDTSDRTNRLILVGLMILAVLTIGGTIISTMGEWQADMAPAIVETE